MVAVIYGSSRARGSSAAMADRLVAGLRAQDKDVQEFRLCGLAIRGCAACYGCKKESVRCVIRDGLEPVLAAVEKADSVVLACGVFWADVPSQVKALIDRCYSFYQPEFWAKENQSRFASRKKLCFLLPQGNGDASLYSDIAARYGAVMKNVGFDFKPDYAVRGIGVGSAADVLAKPELLAAIDGLADKL